MSSLQIQDARSLGAIERDAQHVESLLHVVAGVQRTLTNTAATDSTRRAVRLATELREAMAATVNDLNGLAADLRGRA